MSYEHPTAHEIRISQRLQLIAKKIDKLFLKHTGEAVDFFISTNSTAAREYAIKHPGRWGNLPVGNFVSNMSNREDSARLMLEILAKWEANQDIPPIHTLMDEHGETLGDTLDRGIQ